MDSAEVDKLVKEAEARREEDKKKKESIEARNMADSAVYQAEKTLKDNEGKFDAKL
jgi:molecular chaperone DnaK